MWLERAYPLSYGSLNETINNKSGQKCLVLTLQTVCRAFNCTFLWVYISSYEKKMTENIDCTTLKTVNRQEIYATSI